MQMMSSSVEVSIHIQVSIILASSTIGYWWLYRNLSIGGQRNNQLCKLLSLHLLRPCFNLFDFRFFADFVHHFIICAVLIFQSFERKQFYLVIFHFSSIALSLYLHLSLSLDLSLSLFLYLSIYLSIYLSLLLLSLRRLFYFPIC